MVNEDFQYVIPVFVYLSVCLCAGLPQTLLTDLNKILRKCIGVVIFWDWSDSGFRVIFSLFKHCDICDIIKDYSKSCK